MMEYTLADFDLLISKSVFLYKKIGELKKERQQVMDILTDLLIANNLTKLESSNGQLIELQENFTVPISDMPKALYSVLSEWCKENDYTVISHAKLLSAIQRGATPPVPLKLGNPKAQFVNGSDINRLSVNIKNETVRAWKNTTPCTRDPHVRMLRDSGLTLAQIGEMYGISKTHVSRIVKKKDDLQKYKRPQIVLVELA